MEPIISPMLPYVVSVLANIKATALVIIAVLGVAEPMVACFKDEIIEQETAAAVNKWLKRGLYALAISFVIVVFAPGKETLYQMIALKYLTPDTINYLGGNLQAAVDYIIGQLQSLI